MSILQVRDVDERLYAALKGLAKMEKRSVSQEVLVILEKYLRHPATDRPEQTEAFLQLSAFQEENAKDVIGRIRRGRRNSRRFV